MQKSLLLSITLFFIQSLFAQDHLPIVHSNSVETYFIEGDRKDRSDWWLDPSLELDVYTVDKIAQPRWIKYYTDLDSFQVKIKPGEHFDFLVVLNGKDSCFQRIKSEPAITKYRDWSPTTHDTIPFELTAQNNLKFEAILNEKDTVHLHFDTGGSGLVMTHQAIKEKTELLNNYPPDFETQNYVPLKESLQLKIGAVEINKARVWPVSVQPEAVDGLFGWDYFDGQLVEIDYEKERMIVHSSLAEIPVGYTKLPIEYINGLYCIQGEIEVRGKTYVNRFLFDTGYQRTIVMDSTLVEEQKFPKDLPLLKETTLRNSAGKVFKTKIVEGESVKFGNVIATDVPLQLLNTPNPARFQTHIVGGELLKRFNAILDFQNNFVYLKANSLMNEKYIDAG